MRDDVLYQIGALDALVTDPAVVVARAVRMAVDGTVVDCRIASLCVHGDTPGAVELTKRVRDGLVSAGLQLAPFAFG